MRIHGLLLALLLGAGCHPPDTIVRLLVRLGSAPTPEKLRITLFDPAGMVMPPSTVTPVMLPGTIVMHNINPALPEVCVALEGLAQDGSVTSRGATTIAVLPRMTANAAIELGTTNMLGCSFTSGSDGGARDLASDAARPHDLAGRDLAPLVPICPAGSLFCDDFESGDTRKWDAREVKYDAGAQIDVQTQTVRHGLYALHAAAASPDMGAIVAAHTIVIKSLPSVVPPIALRANVFALQPLDHYGITVELYDDTIHGLSVGADNQNVWTLTEDQATQGGTDRHTDMVPFGAGQWHCIEVVVDAAGMVTLFVDNHQLLPSFPRMSAVAYTTFQVGIGRSINRVQDVYIDDVAVGTTRLYCP